MLLDLKIKWLKLPNSNSNVFSSTNFNIKIQAIKTQTIELIENFKPGIFFYHNVNSLFTTFNTFIKILKNKIYNK